MNMGFAFINFGKNLLKAPIMRSKLFFVLLILVFLGRISAMAGDPFRFVFEKDTIKFNRDSLMKVIQMKDSILLQSSLDSLDMANLIEIIWWEKDSVQSQLQNLQFVLRLDSLYEKRSDSLNRERNRNNRWALRDSLGKIENDSLRANMNHLLEYVYNDSARLPYPQRTRNLWDKLVYHMGNDSTYFWIHYADDDSLQVILKNDQQLSAAIFLTSVRSDSAKVYINSRGKHGLHMLLDEGAFLTHVLKRTVIPESLDTEERTIKTYKIPKMKMPVGIPNYWSLDSWVKVKIDQWGFSNWAASGDNRFLFGFESKGYANYNQGKMAWNSSYWYRYGMIKSEGQAIHKNLDLMKIVSNYTHTAFKKLKYNAGITFDGQFFPGYQSPGDTVPITKFMSPAYSIVGLGMQYNFSDAFNIDLKPISGKFTFVLDTLTVNQQKFGIKEGKRIKGEPGATLSLVYNRTLWKNIGMASTLRLFSNYVNNPQNVDIDFTTRLSLDVNKYVSTSLFFHVIYDDDIIIPFYEWDDGVKIKVGEGKRVQFAESFGIEFTYAL